MMKIFSDHTITSYWQQGKVILIAVIIGKLISFVWKLFLARLGTQSLGIVEISMTLFFTLQSFSLLGLQTALMRFVTIANASQKHNKSRQYVLLAVRISVLMGLVLIFLVSLFPVAASSLVGSSSDILRVAIGYIWIIPLLAINELIWSYWAASHHSSLYGLGKYIIPPVTRCLCLLIPLWFGVTPQNLIIHIVVATVLSFLFSYAFSRATLKPNKNMLTHVDIRTFIRFTVPMSGSFLLYVIYGAMDVILVGKFLGVSSVGLLSATMLLVDIPDMLMSPVLNIFQTHLGSFRSHPVLGFTFALKNMAIFLSIGLALCAVIYIVSPLAIPVLLGMQYVPILQLLGGLLLAKIVESACILPLRHSLDFYGQTRITLLIMMISTAAKLIAGIFVIPSMGLNGIILMQWVGVGMHLTLTVISCVRFLYSSRIVLSEK